MNAGTHRDHIQVARVFGIPIYLHFSWLIIFGLIVWTLSTGYFPARYPDLPASSYWAKGLVTSLLFFVSILLHELGHALAAQRMGMPIRGITLFMFGGVAELGGQPSSAGKEFLMAIAGPGVSAVLALLFWGLSVAGAQAGGARPGPPGAGDATGSAAQAQRLQALGADPIDGAVADGHRGRRASRRRQ